MNVHPDPKSANKATAHYDIDIYRIRPDFSGKIIPCKVMKGIKQRIPFTTIGIAKCDTNKAVTLYPQITGELILILTSDGRLIPKYSILRYLHLKFVVSSNVQVLIPTPILVTTPLF